MIKSDEKIIIAHIIGKWVGGGVESVVMNYYRNIDRNKIQFHFICDEDSTDIPYNEIKKLGGKVILIPPYQKIFKYLKKLKEVFLKENYKIVHSHINTLSVFSLYAAKRAGIPIRIAHSHSTTNKKEKIKNIIKILLRTFAKTFATDFMSCSELAGIWLFGKKEYSKGNIYILNNAIDIEKFKYDKKNRIKVMNELNIDNNTLVLGHVGRFVEQKNHSFLIDIFNEVYKQNNDSVLILIGQGPLIKKIKYKVKKMNLENSVIFLGQINDVSKYYQVIDVLVFPSLYEGLGMAVVEAQTAGCKCVVSNNIPISAKICNNISFLKLSDSKKEWAEVINNSLKNYKRKGYEIEALKKGYDIQSEAKKLEDKYLHLYLNC